MNITTWVKIGPEKAKIETKKNTFSKDVSSVLSFQKEQIPGLFIMDMTKPVKCFHVSLPERITQKELLKIHEAAMIEAKNIYPTILIS